MFKECIKKLSFVMIFVVSSLINVASAQDAATWMPDANLRTAVREALELVDDEVLTQAKMLNLTSLKAPKLEITSISGLEYATNLRSLSIWSNQISDISPLTDLTSLTGLYIGNNQISDINPLANLVNLKRLGMLQNQIGDINALAGLVNLQSLKLAGNPIMDTTTVVNLPKLSDVDIEIPSIIPDANLRKAIRTTLDIEENLRITPNAMKDLSTLNAPKLEITSISGLEHATNLSSLSIGNNQINDISPLTNLTSLTGLYIGNNQISDISPLANLVNLKRLGLLGNQISDIGVLAGLVNLESLKLSGNPITDTSLLASLPKLVDVDIEIDQSQPTKSPQDDDKQPKDETPQVVPNRAPITVGTISPRTLTASGASVVVNVSANFSDPDADNLSYSASSDNTSIVTVSVAGAEVTLTPHSAGSATVTVTASDGKLTATQTIPVTVTAAPVANRAPVTVGAISPRTLTAGGASVRVNVSDNFQDPDNDNISFGVSSDNTGIVSVSVSNSLVTLKPVGAGNAVVTVTASDGELTATQTISVTVVAPNRAPVTVGTISARTLTVGDLSVVVDVSDNFQDPDNDNLSYSASSNDTDIVTVSVSNALVTLAPVGAGNAVVTVTASDGKLTATQTISVTVTAAPIANRAPVTVGAISNQTLTTDGASVKVNVSRNFSDPDDNSLSYSASSENTNVATVSVTDAEVTITPLRVGSAVVTVTASDGKLTATQTISVSVVAANRAPVAVGSIPSHSLTAGGSVVRVDVSANFSDPDDNILTYTASSDDTSVVTASVSGSLVTITPVGAGNTSVTVTASDGKLTATQTISVSVVAANRAPVAVGSIPSYSLTAGGSVVRVDVSANFSDPDDNILTYTASSDDTSVATVSVSGSLVTITPGGTGDATITVTASDGKLTATQTFSVSVDVVDVGKPGVSITVPSGVENDEFNVIITFTEPVFGFEQSDVSVTGTAGVTITEWSANTEETVFTAQMMPTKSGKITVKVNEGVATDAANNPNTASAAQQIEIDITQPDVSFSFDLEELRYSNVVHYTTNGPFTMTITFSEPVSGFEVSDLEVDDEYTYSDFKAVDAKTIDGTSFAATYTVQINPDPNEVSERVRVYIEAGVATDAAGNPNTRAQSTYIEVEKFRPRVEISVPDADVTTATFTIEITFDGGQSSFKRPLGFEQSDLSLTNNTAGATITDWTDNEVGAFEVEITVTQSGSVTFGVSENVATDLAKNGNTAAVSKTVTVTLPGSDPPEEPEVDTTPPSISFSFDIQELRYSNVVHYTTNGPFKMTITFSEPVSGFEVSDLEVDDEYTYSDFKAVDAKTIDGTSFADTYTVQINPDPNEVSERVRVYIEAGVATDAAGNPNTRAQSTYIEVEKFRPRVEISVPDADVTTATFTIGITFDGGQSSFKRPLGFEQSDLSLTNNTAGATITSWTDNEVGAFEVEITATQSGYVTFGVPENVATDLAGNGNTAAVQKTVTVALPGSELPEEPEVDTTSPSISFSFDIQELRYSNVVHYTTNGPFTMTITFSEPVSGFEVSDLEVDDEYTYSDFKAVDAKTIDGTSFADTYTVQINPDPNEVSERVRVYIEAGVATDAAGNPNTRAQSTYIEVEKFRPRVEISVPDADVTTATFTIEITFDGGQSSFKRPLGFEQSDLSLTNNTAGATITGWTDNEVGAFEVEITVTQSGQVTFGVAENVATDLAGNGNTAAVQKTVTITLTDNQGGAPLANDNITDFPSETLLLSNYPNPFNPETWIPYQLAKSAAVTITICDIRGRVVRVLVLGHQAAGVYRSRSKAVHWDGRNHFGEKVAAGVYFYTLKAGDYTATRKMLILK